MKQLRPEAVGQALLAPADDGAEMSWSRQHLELLGKARQAPSWPRPHGVRQPQQRQVAVHSVRVVAGVRDHFIHLPTNAFLQLQSQSY